MTTTTMIYTGATCNAFTNNEPYFVCIFNEKRIITNDDKNRNYNIGRLMKKYFRLPKYKVKCEYQGNIDIVDLEEEQLNNLKNYKDVNILEITNNN